VCLYRIVYVCTLNRYNQNFECLNVILFLICYEQAMKQQRVKLINQIKGDAEQFRKKKAEMAKELLQLKSKVAVDLSCVRRVQCYFNF